MRREVEEHGWWCSKATTGRAVCRRGIIKSFMLERKRYPERKIPHPFHDTEGVQGETCKAIASHPSLEPQMKTCLPHASNMSTLWS
jgi:hypothetical protein